MQNYSKKYFQWYEKIGKIGGKVNLKFFKNYIEKDDTILDFGCGGGFLLENIECKDKYGFEINDYILQKENKIKIFSNFNDLKNIQFDKIISNQVLPHLIDPRKEILQLKKLLKKNGLIISVFTSDGRQVEFEKGDINFKCYSWSPISIGNFFESCGFEIIVCKSFLFRWPPFYEKIYNIFGINIFNIFSYIYGFIMRNKYWNIIVVAKRNN